MEGILDFAKFREGKEMRGDKKAAAEKSMPARSEERRRSRRVSMMDHVFRGWEIWMAVNNMTPEESILFLLRNHPVEAERLKESYDFIK